MQHQVPFTSILIDPANDFEVHHWAMDMQIEPSEFRAAVALVGPRLSDVRYYFGQSAHIISLENWRRPNRHGPYSLPA
jgi:hypothetical protein